MNSLRVQWMTMMAATAASALVLGAVAAWLTDGADPPQRVTYLVGEALAGAFIASIVGYLTTRHIRNRLYEIEAASAMIASGRLSHRIDAVGRNDEIGRLAQQFNEMGERIEQQVTLLQKLAEENRVLAQNAERVAVIEERQRLARELHDSVSQQLFGLTMLAAAAQRQAEAKSEKVETTISQMVDLSNGSLREMRALLLQLRPIELEGRNLMDAIDEFVEALRQRYALDCEVQADLHIDLLPAVEAQLFRVVQEAVANVLKHANATFVMVRLASDAHNVVLTVLDDGVGIPKDALSGQRDSYGIKAMQERANLLGGRCYVWNRESKGTGVEVTVPIVNVKRGVSEP